MKFEEDQDGRSSLMFKKQLKTFLSENNVSAAELARRTGVPKQTISDWLAGTRPRNMEHVRKVAESLGVEINELFFGCRQASGLQNLPEALEKATKTERIESVFRAFIFRSPFSSLHRIVDLKTGLPFEVSDSWERVMGWNCDDVKKRHWLDFVHPEDRQRVAGTVERNAFTGAPVSKCEYRALHKSGAVVRLYSCFAIIPENNVLMCMAEVMDAHSGGKRSDSSDSKKPF